MHAETPLSSCPSKSYLAECSVANLPAVAANAVVSKEACSAVAGVGECHAPCRPGFVGGASTTCNAAGQWSPWSRGCAPSPSERPFCVCA